MAERQKRKPHFDEDAGIYDAYIINIIPFYREMIAALVNALPFYAEREINVLDLGCGTGTVSRIIREKFPAARITCLDMAENMLAKAAERLQGFSNITYVAADFHDLKISDQYEVIVSSLALHHLKTDADKKNNYRHIYEALNRGGVFYNADIVRGPDEHLQNLYLDKWKEYMRQNVSEEEIAHKWLPRHQREDNPATLLRHLSWLQETGFQRVEVIWKYYQLAVFGGCKPVNANEV